MLNIRVASAPGALSLRLAGRLVRGSETALLCRATKQQEREIILGLSGVTAIDAAGVGALVSLQASGKYLILENPSRVVLDTLRLTGLDSIFEIWESPLAGAAISDTAAGAHLVSQPE